MSHGEGLGQTIRTADDENLIADLDSIRVTEGGGLCALRDLIELEQGDIRRRQRRDHLRTHLVAIG